MQFWTGYRYTTNPISFIDPNGLEDFWIAVYNQDLSEKDVATMNKYAVPKEGDNVAFKKFTPGQEKEMYKFLNQNGTGFLEAHGNQIDEAVYYSLAGAVGMSNEGSLLHSTLNSEMKNGNSLVVGACFSERTVDTQKNPNLRAAKGTKGTAYLDDNLKENFGIEFKNVDVTKD